jgi:pyruvate/2-oxoglutarate dehydrogenase complex dihydrolipoamide dehydrogenase (E3) component
VVETAGRALSAKRIVLAMGSRPHVPAIPGLEDAGYLTHVTALDQPHLPASIVILGGGPVGLEFAQTYHRLGAAVTVVEALPEILPHEDPEVGRFIRDELVREGVTVLTGFRTIDVRVAGGSKTATAENGQRVTAHEIFVATGRTPNTDDAGLERAGVALDHGAVRVNRRLETTTRGIWAAGDVTGGLAFTHVADYMARVVVQNALTPVKKTVDYRVVPWVTFTDPEVGRVGLTADEAAARGERVHVHRVNLAEVDRAVVDGRTTGFCKVVARPNGTVLGATIVARGAGELIMEFALAMRYGIRLPQLGSVIHPYPTLSEIVKRTAESWYRGRYGDTGRGRLLRRIVRLWR